MSKRGGIKYVQNDEPAFIRQFKQKIGYKEGPDVDTKVTAGECLGILNSCRLELYLACMLK